MKQHSSHIVDVQGLPDSRQLSINKVGVKELRHPLTVVQRDGQVQATVAQCNLYADLPAAQKGTHMSRFVEILTDFAEPIAYKSIQSLLESIKKLLAAESSYLEFKFPYFRRKTAPVSGVTSLLDYDVFITGALHQQQVEINLKVIVPVTSLCPCSKEISQYGAHNQRSHIAVTVFNAQALWVEDIIDIVEEQASCALFGILKRADEKYVTEKAYENPKFVEDVVRDIAAALNADARVSHYQVTAENFESIHNHSAYAQIDS
jgi:GTP cyclohydrolase I